MSFLDSLSWMDTVDDRGRERWLYVSLHGAIPVPLEIVLELGEDEAKREMAPTIIAEMHKQLDQALAGLDFE